jgi:hypothetical protein
LVSAVAGTLVHDNSSDHSNTPAWWFPLLCKAISLSPSEQFRSQAKRALQRLCGGRQNFRWNLAYSVAAMAGMFNPRSWPSENPEIYWVCINVHQVNQY